jgi:hypothetical protein
MLEVFSSTGFCLVLLMGYAAVIWFPVATVFAARRLWFRVRRSEASSVLVTVSDDQPPPVLFIAHWLVTLMPVTLFVALLSMARRAQVLIGHWPQIMADDPKSIGPTDPLYQRLYELTDFAFGLAGWSAVAWVCLFVVLYGNYNRKQREAIAWAYTAAWVLALLGTGNGIEWYMD